MHDKNLQNIPHFRVKPLYISGSSRIIRTSRGRTSPPSSDTRNGIIVIKHLYSIELTDIFIDTGDTDIATAGYRIHVILPNGPLSDIELGDRAVDITGTNPERDIPIVRSYIANASGRKIGSDYLGTLGGPNRRVRPTVSGVEYIGTIDSDYSDLDDHDDRPTGPSGNLGDR